MGVQRRKNQLETGSAPTLKLRPAGMQRLENLDGLVVVQYRAGIHNSTQGFGNQEQCPACDTRDTRDTRASTSTIDVVNPVAFTAATQRGAEKKGAEKASRPDGVRGGGEGERDTNRPVLSIPFQDAGRRTCRNYMQEWVVRFVW